MGLQSSPFGPPGRLHHPVRWDTEMMTEEEVIPNLEYLRGFCFRTNRAIDQALEAIGMIVDSQVLLLFPLAGGGSTSRFVGVTKSGLLSDDDMGDIASSLADMKNQARGQQLTHSDPQLNDMRGRLESQMRRADAVSRALEMSRQFEGLSVFASARAPIHGHETHTCVGIQTAKLDRFPAFDESVMDRIHVGRSLQHEVIDECLRRADRSLYTWDPNSREGPLGSLADVNRTAASQLIDGLTQRASEIHADLFSKVEAITSRLYERSGARGSLVVADSEKREIKQSNAIDLGVRFKHPVSISEKRTMRKLLELSDGETAVLVAHQDTPQWDMYAYGLGTFQPHPNILEIKVSGHAEWQVSIDNKNLVRVSYGHASIPIPRLEFHKFFEAFERTFGTGESDAVWNVVKAAVGSGNGMTIAISEEPESEAQRLSGQAVLVEPYLLNAAEVIRLGRVDGAVLLGSDASCHAFGVILDGLASGASKQSESRSRGSRYNSAVRYQAAAKHNSLLVVVSDDGMVDLIPEAGA